MFNGNSNDSTLNEYHGSVSGSVLTIDRDQNPNSAYWFDGVDDYISIPSDSLNNLPYGTILTWIKLDEINRQHAILVKAKTWVISYFQLIVDSDNKVRLIIDAPYNTGVQYLRSNTELEKDVWYHISVTWDGNEWKIYINGKLDSSCLNNRTVQDANYYTYIGVNDNENDYYKAFLRGLLENYKYIIFH
ncbi:MAG: LamG domain-containing protein [Candidatus Magnetoglobus multicellularis str. Araruama]|uniref:LamG domain-containing protein n=1 Tax=Candidatus Magnetoglobus multicellularis str. Araruama TaxID=890399 RepID=A0A1V1NZA2_9BACT|nr:MAG: LamG domain-containing protein [Candidatus Magnetoglobus multicellularis str. Araruama]